MPPPPPKKKKKKKTSKICLIKVRGERAEREGSVNQTELHIYSHANEACCCCFRCFCTGKRDQGLCITHRDNPCVRSSNERERPEFPQSYFGVIFVTDAFCDKDGCEGRIVVSEKYRDNKNGGRSREDLVMGLTQHMTVIIIPEDSKWSQVIHRYSVLMLCVIHFDIVSCSPRFSFFNRHPPSVIPSPLFG